MDQEVAMPGLPDAFVIDCRDVFRRRPPPDAINLRLVQLRRSSLGRTDITEATGEEQEYLRQMKSDVTSAFHSGSHTQFTQHLHALTSKGRTRAMIADFLGVCDTAVSKKKKFGWTGSDMTALIKMEGKSVLTTLAQHEASIFAAGLQAAMAKCRWSDSDRKPRVPSLGNLPVIAGVLARLKSRTLLDPLDEDELLAMTKEVMSAAGGIVGGPMDRLNVLAAAAEVHDWGLPLCVTLDTVPEEALPFGESPSSNGGSRQ